jgi:leader peptidase (prepilin peptidase)/N-methyltransferase
VRVLAIAIAGAFGLAVGSFLNVVIHRVPQGLSVVRPASRCPVCGTTLAARDNIPVVSWLALRGRCRTCGAPISIRYPLVELATGVAFLLAAFVLIR